MDNLYYFSMTMLMFLLIVMPILLIWPQLSRHIFIKHIPRKRALLSGTLLFVGLCITIGATEPISIKQARAAEAARQAQVASLERQPQKAVKNIIQNNISATEIIPFTEEQTTDAALPLGQTKVVREGINGEKTLTFSVTLTDGKETARKLIEEKVTGEPTSKIIATGTYVAPAPAPQSSSSSCEGYYNVNGNYVCSPSSNPSGASARCNDGTYSYSQNRRGTCSRHGGVAEWY